MIDRSVLWSNDAHASRGALEALLTECQGNVTLASRRAGIERQSMHRLLKRHGLSARDFRPRGGGSIIARAALKNLDQQLAPQRPPSRDFTRSVIREAEARRPGVTVTHPAAIEKDVRRASGTPASGPDAAPRERGSGKPASAADTAPREPAAAGPSEAIRNRVPLTAPEPRRARASLTSPSFERLAPTRPANERPPLVSPSFERLAPPRPANERPPLVSPSFERLAPPRPADERPPLASPSFERLAPARPADERPPLIERPVTAGELADRAFERRRGIPHHRPYQSPLGAAALQALGLRKTAAR